MPPDMTGFTWHGENLTLDLAYRGYKAHLHG
jgi:hypothetical protein